MALFGGGSSPYDALVEKATAEHASGEDWATIIEAGGAPGHGAFVDGRCTLPRPQAQVCDKVTAANTAAAARDALKSIDRRLEPRRAWCSRLPCLALPCLGSCRSRSNAAAASGLTGRACNSSRPCLSSCLHEELRPTFREQVRRARAAMARSGGW